MRPDQKIVIGERVLTREELFREEEEFRKGRARFPFEEKIRILVDLPRLAFSWGCRILSKAFPRRPKLIAVSTIKPPGIKTHHQ